MILNLILHDFAVLFSIKCIFCEAVDSTVSSALLYAGVVHEDDDDYLNDH